MSENNNSFRYTYSAKEQNEIDAIRKKYVEDTVEISDKMTLVRKLDAGVTNKATTVSLCVGILFALIMGFGMSLIMSELGDFLGTTMKWVIGLVCGLIGMAGVIAAYPLYGWVLTKERKKIAPQILKLTEELSEKKSEFHE